MWKPRTWIRVLCVLQKVKIIDERLILIKLSKRIILKCTKKLSPYVLPMLSFYLIGHGKELVLKPLFICINENLFILINYFNHFMESSFILETHINYDMFGYKFLAIISKGYESIILIASEWIHKLNLFISDFYSLHLRWPPVVPFSNRSSIFS